VCAISSLTSTFAISSLDEFLYVSFAGLGLEGLVLVLVLAGLLSVIRPHRLHAVYKMRPVGRELCRTSRGLCVGHMGELCENG